MSPRVTKKSAWLRRKYRVRKKVRGDSDCLRLNVYRSNKHIYAQIVDDTSGKTQVAASTLSPEVKSAVKNTGNIDAAKQVGMVIAQKCLEKKITKVVFDRGGFLFHGRVKALAQSARENGLQF